jgi:hypothetical protein
MLKKCLNVMKTGLWVTELACGIANERGQIVCGLGKSHTNFGRYDSYVTVECCNFVFGQTRSISMLWVGTQNVF